MHSYYKNPQVRQLAWCLSSPPLFPLTDIRLFNPNKTGQLDTWLRALDNNPAPLNIYLNHARSALLGIRFERYLQFFCQYGPGMQLNGANLQVDNGGITQGEYDLLCTQTGENLHLEAAVKFYLCLPDCSGQNTAHWYGPQNHDRLDLKIAKLYQQLALSQTPAGQQSLRQHGLDPHPSPCYLLNGMLFGQWQKTTFNPAPSQGYWLWQRQVAELLSEHSDWQLLDKTDWLGPNLMSTALNPQQAHIVISQHFATHTYGRMLVKLQWDRASGMFAEQQRYILVHDNWPLKS